MKMILMWAGVLASACALPVHAGLEAASREAAAAFAQAQLQTNVPSPPGRAVGRRESLAIDKTATTISGTAGASYPYSASLAIDNASLSASGHAGGNLVNLVVDKAAGSISGVAGGRRVSLIVSKSLHSVNRWPGLSNISGDAAGNTVHLIVDRSSGTISGWIGGRDVGISVNRESGAIVGRVGGNYVQLTLGVSMVSGDALGRNVVLLLRRPDVAALGYVNGGRVDIGVDRAAGTLSGHAGDFRVNLKVTDGQDRGVVDDLGLDLALGHNVDDWVLWTRVADLFLDGTPSDPLFRSAFRLIGLSGR